MPIPSIPPSVLPARHAVDPALGSLVDTLRGDRGSVTLVMQGDSTSSETVGSHGFLLSSFVAQLAPLVPSARIQMRKYASANEAYDPWQVIQAGAAGERGVRFTNASTGSGRYWTLAECPAPTSDFMVEVKVALDNWSVGTNTWFASRWGAVGNRAWRFGMTGGTNIMFEYTVDGTASVYFSASTWTRPANGAATRFRLTYQVNNGSSQRVLRLYQSTDDGVNWTQIGSTSTVSGASAPYAATGNIEIGSAAGSSGLAAAGSMVGSIYDCVIREGLTSGQILNPQPVESARRYFGNDGTSIIGSPTLYVWNASVTGQNIAYHTHASGRFVWEVPKAWPCIHMLNDSHNEAGDVGAVWTTSLSTWRTAALARNPDAALVALGQNPRVASYGYPEREHRQRQAALPIWCARNGVRWVDTGRPFYAADGSVDASLILVDLTHPTPTGDALRAAEILRELA